MDIFKMALVVIYPDGYVDQVPIKEGCTNHVKYWYDYLKISPRFQRIIRENRFKFDWIHDYNASPILKLLAKNNVIVFMNTEIAYVCSNMENAEALYGFIISFPRDYDSHKGLPFAKETINKLNFNRYELDVFRTDKDDFEEFDTEEYERFFGENKVNEEEEKKL